MRTLTVHKLCALAGLFAIVACSASSGDPVFNGPGKGGAGGGNTGGSGGTQPLLGGSGGGGGSLNLDADLNNDGAKPGGCTYADGTDHDGDGYSYNDGDCNDCDPNVNPGAFDDGAPTADGGAPVDSNCDGAPGGDTWECDDGIQIADGDAVNGAKAIGLCRTADPNATGKNKTWGVLSAKYVKADGAPGMNDKSHGVVPGFGAANVQQGKVMLVLSSGTARAPGQPGFESPDGASMGTDCGKPIPNMDTPACPGVETGDPNDPAALEVEIRVPTNAKSLTFNLNFYTYEFPEFICSQFNDFFVTLMDPKPQGSNDGNISFDQDTNPISVNNSMLQVCEKQTAGNKNFACPLGAGLLNNTGFDESGWGGPHAATGWLQTTAPVTPGSTIKLRFAIWDSGDKILDSTVLIDNFTFSVEPATGGTTTKPVETPK